MTILLTGIALTLVVNGLTMGLVERAFHDPALAAHHFQAPARHRVTPEQKQRLYPLNVLLSLTILFGTAYFLYPYMFTEGPVSPLTVVLHAAAVLVVYDGLYYVMHRWLFHHKKLMRLVHGLHHSARTPSALESLLTHPVEVTAGLGLLLFCTWLIGPVHIYTFLLANFVYSELNIVVHSGVAFPSGPMRLLNPWARAHHGHHAVDMDRNYANLTPFWDRLFGTAI